MDTSDPDISFDESGASNYVGYYQDHFAQLVADAQSGRRLPELHRLVEQIKSDGRGKQYDVIVGVSGGVDSTYLALQASRLGLRVLAVHFDSGWNSELAVGNIHNLITNLGIDLYTQVVDWREMRDLQLAFLKSGIANADTPTDHAFGFVALEQAKKHGIKHILSGSNYVSESILPASWEYTSDDARLLKAIQRRFGTVKLKSYPVMSTLSRKIWHPYVRGIRTHDLLNYIPYHYNEAKEQISRELGWRDYGGKHYESVFTRWFQGYYLPTRFGYDKRIAHLSSLILAGEMTREEALSRLEADHYPEPLRTQDHAFIAKKIGISVEELDSIVSAPTKTFRDYPNSDSINAKVFALTNAIGRIAGRLRVSA